MAVYMHQLLDSIVDTLQQTVYIYVIFTSNSVCLSGHH